MQEVRDLIAFYDARSWDWTLAVEFTIWKSEKRKYCNWCKR